MKNNGGVAFFLDQHHMIPSGSTVLCAVSGGADSVCLLHILHSLQPAYGFTLVAAHYNHELRGEEADRDEGFVQDLCRQWNIPLTVGHGDVAAEAKLRKQGIEETARKMRYDFLCKTAEKAGAERIATAHTFDDNAETILLNIIRGTGLSGLAGIQPVSGPLIRPLLSCTRQDVEEYLVAQQLPHIEDSSNRDLSYRRNKLRLQVMPLLRELNPKAAEHINQLTDVCSVADQGLEAEARRLTRSVSVQDGRVAFPCASYFQAPAGTQSRILFQLLDKLGVGRKDFGSKHLIAIDHMMRFTVPGRESRLDLPHNVTARFSQDWLTLETRQQKPTDIQLMANCPAHWGDYILTLLDRPAGEGLSLCQNVTGIVEHPTLEWGPVTVAPCPPGQRLTLPGSNGARTVKRLCLDQGIDLSERDGLPAIYVGDRLAAVWQLGVDIEFSPGPDKNFCRFIQIIKA